MKRSTPSLLSMLAGAAISLIAACAVSPSGPGAAHATSLAGPVGSPASSGAAALPKHIVMFYRKETSTAPNRLDTRIQAAALALEQEFLSRQYQLTQPSAEALQALDQGPDVIVNFAADAGLSMIYSVYTDLRPQVGTDVGIAEVRIMARVFVGATELSAATGRGQIQVRTDPATREYGERRGFELASQYAAKDLADRVQQQLDALTTEQIAEMLGADSPATTSFVVVTPPSGAASPPPASPPASSTAPPPPAVVAQPPPAAAPPAPDITPPSGPAPGPGTPPGPSSAGTGKRWLVTVGVSDYSHVRGVRDEGTHAHDLPGAPKDVGNVQDTLAGFGFDASTTTRLFDSEATTNAVRAALQRLTATAGPNDTVVLYITGHGMPKPYGRAGVTMPLFYDTDVSSRGAASEALDFGEIATTFAQIPARQLVLLIDTCYSGSAAAGIAMTTVTVGAKGVQVSKSTGSPDIARLLTARKKGLGSDVAVMTAARPDEVSWDLGEKKGSLFTANLLHGLGETRGRQPLEGVYQQYVWPAVIDTSRDICRRMPPSDSCVQQSPVLGYLGAGNLIKLASDSK